MQGEELPALEALAPEVEILGKIPIGYARRHLLLPCRDAGGELVLLSGRPDAAEAIGQHLAGASTEHMIEMTEADRRRVFQLGYYTWVEQQGRTAAELRDARVRDDGAVEAPDAAGDGAARC